MSDLKLKAREKLNNVVEVALQLMILCKEYGEEEDICSELQEF